MKRIIGLLLIPGLCAALYAADASTQKNDPASILLTTFGKKGVDALHRRGFISLSDGSGGPQITHVQWALLRGFGKTANAYRSFISIYRKNRKRLSVAGSLNDLRVLQRQPIGGLMTPSVRAAVDTLAATLNDAGILNKRLAAAPEGANLFETKWARDFLKRRNAPMMLAPRAEATSFFHDVLSRQKTAERSRSAFLEFVSAVYDQDITEALDADLKAAKLSAAVENRLGKYLADQRLLWSVSDTRSRLRAIERSGTLTQDAVDIEYALEGFQKNESIEKTLRSAMTAAAEPEDGAAIRFSAPELHVHTYDGSTTLDVGDHAAISMAFWIYGVPNGKELKVSQLAFIDHGSAGISNRTEKKVRLKNGGPFSFSVKVPILSQEPFTFRLLFTSPGAKPFSREIEIQPSPRYHEILSRAAEADREAASCMLEDAVDHYDAVIETLTPLAKKRRFGALLRAVSARRRTAQHQTDVYGHLQGAIDGAKLFASKDQCEYKDSRARRALRLLSELPAGCDAMPEGTSGRSLSEELRRLTRITHRRAQAQNAFRSAVKEARSQEGRCRSERATELYASALALLDADAGARCGAWEQEYTLIRIEDFPRAIGASGLAQALASAADEAEKRFAENDASGALQMLLLTLAKINSIPDADCYDSSRRRIVDLTEAYGVALSPGSPKQTAASAKLPADSTKKAVQAVLAEKRRREKKLRADYNAERSEQAPDTAASSRGNR